MAEDYCDLCELPRSQCIHGQPPPPPPTPKPAPAPRTTAPRVARAVKTRTPAAPVRPPSRRTDQATFRAHILAVLAAHAGRLDAEEMLVALGERMDDVLLQRDKEPNPQGELRWQTSARAERRAMIDEGLMVVAQPGVWELTDAGRRLSAKDGPES